ncbi:hypothetical protein BD770DRAFT_408245 [Pilaira anomala]|nr:hypothetical protein BD770DRAFT_408245 [Pilaira anomala]
MVSTRSNTTSNQNNNQQATQRSRQSINHHKGPRGSHEKTSQKIRKLAIQYCNTMDDMPITKAAKQLGVKRSTLSTHVNIYRSEGHTEPKKRGRRKGSEIKFNASQAEFLKNTLDNDSTQTISILTEKLTNNFPDLAEQNISLGASGLL